MEAGVDLTEQLEDELLVEDRSSTNSARLERSDSTFEMRPVLRSSSTRTMAVCRQTVGEVRADESCSTRDQVPQERVPFIGQAEVTRAYPGPK